MRLILLLLMSFCVHLNADTTSDKYGKEVFDRLRAKYPQHFSLKSSIGGNVAISENDPIGKYVISKFALRSRAGWLCWWGRQPVIPENVDKSYRQAINGQITFHKKEECVEILLSKNVEEKDFPKEEFWRVLIYELCNASNQGFDLSNTKNLLNGGDLNKMQYADLMVRIEYRSAAQAQDFQNKIWRDFCKSHLIDFAKEPWFYQEGTTEDQWFQAMKKSDIGKKYRSVYE